MLTPTGFIVESNVIAVLIERRTKIMLYLFGQPNNAYARSQILGSSLVKPRWQWCFFGGFEVLIGSWNYPNNNKLSKVESILMSACIFEHCFFDIVIHRKIKQAGHTHMKSHAWTIKSNKTMIQHNNPFQPASGNFFPLSPWFLMQKPPVGTWTLSPA